jgi:GT2 family glycosyltransferase
MAPRIAAVIATRNRLDECRLAIQSLLDQSLQPIEVVVYDDASDRDVARELAGMHPRIQWVRWDTPRGATGCRSHALQNCTADYLISIDDDCWLSAPTIVEQAILDIERHPAWGAVGLPLVEPSRLPQGHREFIDAVQRIGPEILEMQSFLGGSVIFRMDAIRSVGGVRTGFEMLGGEEADLAIRLIAQDWKIGYSPTAPVVHTVSPSRDQGSKFYFDARSALLCDALNGPFPLVLWTLFKHSVQLFKYRLSWQNLTVRTQGVAAGLWAALKNWQYRTPMTIDQYRKLLRLPRHGVVECPDSLRVTPTRNHPHTEVMTGHV